MSDITSYVYDDSPQDRVPSLISLCQRVAANHAESISNLGSQLRFGLVRPMLERCSPDQLMRLEEASPDLKSSTSDIWKNMCLQKYRMLADEYYSVEKEPQEPDSWRNRFYFLQEAEIKRFEEVGQRIRSQRMEADERKREREVRFTDRVPPPKRLRTGVWGTPSQPKTLFQKTRTEASKIQKAFFNSRSLPHRHVGGKTVRVHATPDHTILPATPKSIPGRVTVNTISVARRDLPSPSPSASSSNTTSPSTRPSPQAFSSSFDRHPHLTARSHKPELPTAKTAPLQAPPSRNTAALLADSLASPMPRYTSQSLKSPMKKDPMASLFVPKRRAHSHRPHS